MRKSGAEVEGGSVRQPPETTNQITASDNKNTGVQSNPSSAGDMDSPSNKNSTSNITQDGGSVKPGNYNPNDTAVKPSADGKSTYEGPEGSPRYAEPSGHPGGHKEPGFFEKRISGIADAFGDNGSISGTTRAGVNHVNDTTNKTSEGETFETAQKFAFVRDALKGGNEEEAKDFMRALQLTKDIKDNAGTGFITAVSQELLNQAGLETNPENMAFAEAGVMGAMALGGAEGATALKNYFEGNTEPVKMKPSDLEGLERDKQGNYVDEDGNTVADKNENKLDDDGKQVKRTKKGAVWEGARKVGGKVFGAAVDNATNAVEELRSSFRRGEAPVDPNNGTNDSGNDSDKSKDSGNDSDHPDDDIKQKDSGHGETPSNKNSTGNITQDGGSVKSGKLIKGGGAIGAVAGVADAALMGNLEPMVAELEAFGGKVADGNIFGETGALRSVANLMFGNEATNYAYSGKNAGFLELGNKMVSGAAVQAINAIGGIIELGKWDFYN